MEIKRDLILIVKNISDDERQKILDSIPKSKDGRNNYAKFDYIADASLFHHIDNDLNEKYEDNSQEIDEIDLFNKALELFNNLPDDELDNIARNIYQDGDTGLINDEDYRDIINEFFDNNCKKEEQEDITDDLDLLEDDE